jgi:hypothetical protein
MKLLRQLQNRFFPAKGKDINLLSDKYEHLFFKDKSIQQEIAIKGYAVRKLLEAPAIQALKMRFADILQHPDNGVTEQFWNSGRAENIDIRNMAKAAIDQYLKPDLEHFFPAKAVDLMGGVFVAKPPGKDSGLNPHQDSSHVDEHRFFSVYAWTALDDTFEKNGAVYIVPGSHLFGNHQRSLNIPWQFQPYTDILWQYAVPVPMKEGEVLFFDSAAIHCSPPNETDQLRLGVNFFIKPKVSPFLHYYQKKDDIGAPVEKFEVNTDFYYKEDFLSRPPAKYPFAGAENYHRLHLNKKKVHQLCENGRRAMAQI